MCIGVCYALFGWTARALFFHMPVNAIRNHTVAWLFFLPVNKPRLSNDMLVEG